MRISSLHPATSARFNSTLTFDVEILNCNNTVNLLCFSMTKVIAVNERGALTLPKDLREKLGVTGGGQLIAEIDANGALTLRPGMVLPIEIYSDERIVEFQKLNELPLAGKKLRWRKAR